MSDFKILISAMLDTSNSSTLESLAFFLALYMSELTNS
jgi:hypothetical protein